MTSAWCPAATATNRAALPFRGTAPVELVGAAQALLADGVEEVTNVRCGESVKAFPAQHGPNVEPDGALVSPLPCHLAVGHDLLKPVVQVFAEATGARRNRNAAAVLVQEGGQLAGNICAGLSVDALAATSAVCGQDVGGGLPAPVSTLIDGSLAVGPPTWRRSFDPSGSGRRVRGIRGRLPQRGQRWSQRWHRAE